MSSSTLTSRSKMETVEMPPEISRDIFPIMDLPAELRELIYHWASAPFPPIDTAAILDTRERVHIPKVAKLNRAIREEALAVFYRNRELKISLHCERNVFRAVAWLDSVGTATVMPDLITFSGAWKRSFFFHIDIQCSTNEPQFTVASRPGSMVPELVQLQHEDLCVQIRHKLGKKTMFKKTGKLKGKLTGGEVKDVLNLVRMVTGWARLPAQREHEPDTNW